MLPFVDVTLKNGQHLYMPISGLDGTPYLQVVFLAFETISHVSQVHSLFHSLPHMLPLPLRGNALHRSAQQSSPGQVFRTATALVHLIHVLAYLPGS